MKTLIKVDENYKVIEKKVINEKPLPNEVIDLIVPILKGGLKK